MDTCSSCNYSTNPYKLIRILIMALCEIVILMMVVPGLLWLMYRVMKRVYKESKRR